MGQYSVTKQVQNHFKPLYEDLFKKASSTFYGVPNENIPRPLFSDSEEEREANFEKLWDLGGFNFWRASLPKSTVKVNADPANITVGNYEDVLRDRTCNEVAYAFWRKKVGERIKDPVKRAVLAPEVAPHPLGAKRPSLEQRFYETFNQDNVDLVDLNATPILEMYENGVKTAEKEYELDVLVFATGTHG